MAQVIYIKSSGKTRSPLGDRYLSALITQRLARSEFESHCGQVFFILQLQMKSTMTYSELIPCFKDLFAIKYGCRFQCHFFHVSFNQRLARVLIANNSNRDVHVFVQLVQNSIVIYPSVTGNHMEGLKLNESGKTIKSNENAKRLIRIVNRSTVDS